MGLSTPSDAAGVVLVAKYVRRPRAVWDETSLRCRRATALARSRRRSGRPGAKLQESEAIAVILNDTSRLGISTPSFATARAGGSFGKNLA